MFAAAAIILIFILCVSHLYLKSSTLRSFTTAIAAVVAVIAALGYYEIVSAGFISKGYGGQWVQPAVFAIMFCAVFAVTKALADLVLPRTVEFGRLPAKIAGVVCGIIAGLIISGALFILIAMTPFALKWPYTRFEHDNININSPKNSLLNSDGIVAALFGWISKGSMSSDKSFAVYHANFIDQLHLNRHKATDGVYMITAADSIVIPEKGGVRIVDIDQRNYTIVRMGIKSGKIDQGGAMDNEGDVLFSFSQIRILCKQKGNTADMTGSARPVYPEAQLLDNEIVPVRLNETINIARSEFESVAGYGKVAWIDLAFSVPANMIPVLLEFKQNAVVPLTRPVLGIDETDSLPAAEQYEEDEGYGQERGRGRNNR